jgi:PAS domain S-box-containing protein
MTMSNREELPSRTRAILPEDLRSGEYAVALGSRAGIIEWADDAWLRVSGYRLDRFLDKPVSALLEHVKLEPSIVEFIGGCVNAQRVCEVDVPLTTPTGAGIWVHLRVEPVLDTDGELSDFVAVARNITEAKHAEARAREAAATAVTAVDLSELAASVARTHREALHPMTAYDLWLDEDLPIVLADPTLLEGLLGRAIRRAAVSMQEGWGTLSISTGLLGSESVALYPGNLYRGLPHAQFAYVEVHDTGDAPAAGPHRVVDEPFLTNHHPGEALRIATARQRLASVGGEIRLASSPWFGTSVVLLLPYSVEPELEIH